jgi:cytochrome c-type biogenesis protein CcmE
MKKKVIIILAVIACGALAYLLFALFNARAPYAVTISDFIAKENSYIGKQTRVDGYVMQDTIDWTSPGYSVRFVLGNGEVNSLDKLTVFYTGEKPDPNKFIGGIKILVAGKYDKDQVFLVDSITYECPNEYKDK